MSRRQSRQTRNRSIRDGAEPLSSARPPASNSTGALHSVDGAHRSKTAGLALAAWTREPAREEMILANLGLVSFALSNVRDAFRYGAWDQDDAMAFGILGLIQAVDSFDPTKGTAFATFAFMRIRGSIIDVKRKMDLLPRTLRQRASALEQERMELAAHLGRWPTRKELAARLGKPLKDVLRLEIHSRAGVLSLDELMRTSTDSNRPWEPSDPDEAINPEEALVHETRHRLVQAAIKSLSPRDRALVQMRYGRALTFKEIGRIMNLTESRICQLNIRILSSLRLALQDEPDVAA
jgi:RNA polymerase sigma factor for flagellar operon FliA